MTSQNFIKRDLLLLTLILALLFGAFLGTRPLMVPDEGRYAEIPREMVETNDYLTPRLNYLKYFEKPALFYWMEAASIKVFGLNEWALRAVVGIMSLLSCLMVYIAGLRLYDRRTGILGCLILASCALYFSMARFVITDMPLTAWITISLLLFILGTQEPSKHKKRYYFWGMYACAALAVMTKGLVGAVFPGLIIFIWLCVTHEWRQLKTYCLITGSIVFLLIAAPWHILVQLKNPEFFQFYFIDQHFLRYLTDYAGRQQAIWFFPVITLGGFFPWVCFLVGMTIQASKKIKHWEWTKYSPCPDVPERQISWGGLRHKQLQSTYQSTPAQATVFFVLWAAILFTFYSLSKSQLLSYALPIMPPLALLTARYLSLHWESKADRTVTIGFLLAAILGSLMSVGGIIALHLKSIQPPTLAYVGITILLIGTLGSYLLYSLKGTKAGIVALIITAGTCFTIGDVTYPQIDDRSLKPLVAILKPVLKADTEVAVYHEYYQDLPAYLARRVTVVGYTGELAFGTQHQDTRDWMIDENTFWERWRNKPGMFMIISLDDYATLKKQQVPFPLYPVAQTTRVILLKNSP